ncbi:NADH dehydrogenase [Hirschfeldia incana]|nr:NADH dehydrogenase [Hirschfeldia incana]
MTTVRQKATATLPKLIRAMRKESPKQQNNLVLPSLRRAFSLYDQINLIDNVPEDQLRFQEVNGVKYEGSLLCVGNLLMSWSPRSFSEITTDSLSIFQTVRPIPELLIIGCGRYNHPVSPQVRQFVKSIGMKLETLDSRNAASTYNILNEEGRIVAAALLPYGFTSRSV